MSGQSSQGTPFSIEAAHAADKQKEITYPVRPPAEAPDYDGLRERALALTRTARRELRHG